MWRHVCAISNLSISIYLSNFGCDFILCALLTSHSVYSVKQTPSASLESGLRCACPRSLLFIFETKNGVHYDLEGERKTPTQHMPHITKNYTISFCPVSLINKCFMAEEKMVVFSLFDEIKNVKILRLLRVVLPIRTLHSALKAEFT